MENKALVTGDFLEVLHYEIRFCDRERVVEQKENRDAYEEKKN